MKISAGDLDRRVQILEATETRDKAGDTIQTFTQRFSRWAKMRQQRGYETQGSQQLVRNFDAVFTMREDVKTKTIAPETFRIVHAGREYLIVGVQRTADREDGLDFLCSSRPDMRGAKAPDSGSGEL
jgi:head-tail adaptor